MAMTGTENTGNFRQLARVSGLEGFFREVSKLRVCSDDARGPSAPENARMVSRRVSHRFSLCGRAIRCRCMPLASAPAMSLKSRDFLEAVGVTRNMSWPATTLARSFSEKKRAVDDATSQLLDVARENTNPIAAHRITCHQTTIPLAGWAVPFLFQPG